MAKNSSSESEFSTPALTRDLASLLRPVLNNKEFLVTDDIEDAELNEEWVESTDPFLACEPKFGGRLGISVGTFQKIAC